MERASVLERLFDSVGAWRAKSPDSKPQSYGLKAEIIRDFHANPNGDGGQRANLMKVRNSIVWINGYMHLARLEP